MDVMKSCPKCKALSSFLSASSSAVSTERSSSHFKREEKRNVRDGNLSMEKKPEPSGRAEKKTP